MSSLAAGSRLEERRTWALLQRLLAVALAAFVALEAATFPAATTLLAFVLGGYALALWRTPLAWLVALPALIPVLDLTPVSGRHVFNEFDLLVLLSVAGCLWHGVYASLRPHLGAAALGLLSLLTVAEAIATARGLVALTGHVAGEGPVYLSELNPLRVARGYGYALLLLPALDALVRRDAPVARALCTGMLLGLATCALSVAWERLLFPGPFDFGVHYRVTGLFSGMHTGGASLDAYLAMSVPFFAVAFYVYRGRTARVLGAGLLLLGVHALLVTFSRTSLAALAFILAVFVLRDVAAGRREGRVRHRAATSLLLLLAVGAVAVPIVGGTYFTSRLESVAEALRTRFDHWSRTVALLSGGLDAALGAGKGTFPAAWRAGTDAGRHMASFSLESEGGTRFVRFTASDPAGTLYLRQRFSPREPGVHRLTITLRSHATPPDKLLVELCERLILQPRSGCRWLGIRTDAAPSGEWQVYNRPLDLRRFDGDGRWLSRPLEIVLLNRGLRAPLDVARVQITAPSGEVLLDNPAFEDRLDSWFFSSGDHLAWHVKNMWLGALFEGGALGALALAAFTGWLLWTLARRLATGEPLAAMLLAALGGLAVVGLFDSPFDDPRVAFVFYLLAFTGLRDVRLDSATRTSRLPWGPLLATHVLVAGGVAIAGIAWLARVHDMGVHQVVRVGMQRMDVNWPWLATALAPEPRYLERPLDGRIRTAHPRILLPELAGWSGTGPAPVVAARLARYGPADRKLAERACTARDIAGRAACHLATGDPAEARRLLDALANVKLSEPAASGDVGPLWELALGYDLLRASPAATSAGHAALEGIIRHQVGRILGVLDDAVAALYHTRVSLAASAWLGAVVLDPAVPGNAGLQARAQGHLMDSLAALSLTESWPGGYNYWINNRGLLVALAGAAYVNGLEDTAHAGDVRELLRRLGLWTVHATRPDHRVEGLGDEGPRVDLKDETRRVIDVLAQITRDPVLAGYSAYLRTLHRGASYYRGYRGQFLLFNDPTVAALGDGTLASLDTVLPRAALFGRGAMNLAYLRSGWGPDDTFVSFRAGHTFAHHGHYDAGHFSLYKGAPLAINSGTYGGVATPHRLYYAVRSVAKNTVLVLRPDEPVVPNRLFELQVADGGQRLTQPTGSTIDSTDRLLANLHAGRHLEGGHLTAFEDTPAHVLIAADLTAAYNSTAYDDTGANGKVAAMKRWLLYLHAEDRLLVHDDVTATEPGYVKKWLLHTVERPQAAGLRVLVGAPENGILETAAPRALVRNGAGRLVVDRLFPADAVMRVVGGDDHRYYVETDGDETELDGRNFTEGANERPWFDAGRWRLEIQPPPRRLRDRFLVVLTPSLETHRESASTPVGDAGGTVVGALGTESAVLFVDARPAGRFELDAASWPRRVHLIGLPVSAEAIARLDGRAIPADGAGRHVRTFDLGVAQGAGRLAVSWE